MSRPINPIAPPTTQTQCTLYFYTWACGHKEWVHCSNCDLDEPNNYRAHLEHEHREVGLSEPRHPCPACDHPPLLEEQLASLDTPLYLDIRRNLAIVNSSRLVRNARVEEEVEAIEAPWRQGFDEVDMMPDDRLTNRILIDNWQTTQLAERLEEWQGSFSTHQPSGPGSVSTVRPTPPQQAAEESTTPTPASQQTTPRQLTTHQFAPGLSETPQQRSGHDRRQSSASTQSSSGPAYNHPLNTQWGSAQQGYRAGFAPIDVPQQRGDSMVLGPADLGRGRGQPSFFAPGSAARGGSTTSGAAGSYGQPPPTLHHLRHNSHSLRGGPHGPGGMSHRDSPHQHYPTPSGGVYQQGPHQRSHSNVSNQPGPSFQQERSNNSGLANFSGSPTPPVHDPSEGGSAEQTVNIIENLHISDRASRRGSG